MADLIRPMVSTGSGFSKDKLGSPSTESEDGGTNDIADLAADLDLDEVDRPSANGEYIYSLRSFIFSYSIISFMFLGEIYFET